MLLATFESLAVDAVDAEAEALAASLRQGGYVVFIPHTQSRRVDAAEFVSPPGCPSGTRLSAQGWRDAKAAGIGLIKQGVRVEVAYTSPVCAARHTGYLLFGADKVRLDEALAIDCTADVPASNRYVARLTQRLSKAPPYAGFNLAIVGHVCGLAPITLPDQPSCAQALKSGDVIVFKPAGMGYQLVGCIAFTTLEAWSRRDDLP